MYGDLLTGTNDITIKADTSLSNVITSQGPGRAVCFGLAIVRKLVGEETTQQIKEGMLLDYC